MGIFQTGSGHFSIGKFFLNTFGALFVSYFTKNLGKKGTKTFGFDHPPPPFLPKIPKLLGHKKVPKNFWIDPEPPAPFWKITKLKLEFFMGPPLGSCATALLLLYGHLLQYWPFPPSYLWKIQKNVALIWVFSDLFSVG